MKTKSMEKTYFTPPIVPGTEFPHWPDGALGALESESKDIPTLTPFFAPPGKSNGTGVLVCHGGHVRQVNGRDAFRIDFLVFFCAAGMHFYPRGATRTPLQYIPRSAPPATVLRFSFWQGCQHRFRKAYLLACFRVHLCR